MLKSLYSEECLSRTSVFEWNKRFKGGQESLHDDEQKGCPSTSRTEESTEVIPECLAEEQTLSVRMLEEITGINRETVHKILVEDLKKKWDSGSWYLLHENAPAHSSDVVSEFLAK
jgi:predicted HTH transcriptional regulator